VCCSVLHCVAVCCSVLPCVRVDTPAKKEGAVAGVAARFQAMIHANVAEVVLLFYPQYSPVCVAMGYSVCYSVSWRGEVCCHVFQCVAVCCSVLQCVAVM